MEKSIIFRAYESGDAPDLADIIRKTWQYDKFCSPKLAKRLSRLYLFSCLAGQTFTRVAVQEGKAVGIIMGRSKRKKPSLRFVPALAQSVLAVFCSQEGRRMGKAFSNIQDIDQALLENRRKEYEGELCFFAVSGESRGTGIGKALFVQFMDYMKSENIKSFYLYTDSSCNYGFYERQGMARCGETTYSVPIGYQNEMDFYLYEYVDAA